MAFRLNEAGGTVKVLMRAGGDWVKTELPAEYVARRLESGTVEVDGDAPEGFTVRAGDMWLHEGDVSADAEEPPMKVRPPRKRR